MRAIEAKTFSGYGGLQQIELAKLQPVKDKVLVRITAAGAIEDAGDCDLTVGSRVMFTGPYGVDENGTWQEWLGSTPSARRAKPCAI